MAHGRRKQRLVIVKFRNYARPFQRLAQRTDVDQSRFGLWGTNLGSYAALSLAESDPRVRAIAVESVYERPQEMLRILVNRYGIGSLPLLPSFAERGFGWLNYANAGVPPLSQRLSRLSGVPKLFIEAGDEPVLAKITGRLFLASPEPKEEVTLPRGKYAGMLDEEKRSYENRIASFFLFKPALIARRNRIGCARKP